MAIVSVVCDFHQEIGLVAYTRCPGPFHSHVQVDPYRKVRVPSDLQMTKCQVFQSNNPNWTFHNYDWVAIKNCLSILCEWSVRLLTLNLSGQQKSESQREGVHTDAPFSLFFLSFPLTHHLVFQCELFFSYKDFIVFLNSCKLMTACLSFAGCENAIYG